MNIVFAASESAPFIKSGGLGDVMEALPKELSKGGNKVSVFIPYYRDIKIKYEEELEYLSCFDLHLSWRNLYCGIFKKEINENLTYYFIDNEFYFGREGGIYGHLDDGERFAFFQKAIIEAIIHLNIDAEVIHVNDWQTACIPLILKATGGYGENIRKIKTVLTIHNIEYQGKADKSFITEVLGVDPEWSGAAEFDGCFNSLKCGIVLCDRLSTVSPTYAFELRHAYFAHGLSQIISENSYKMKGILNGIGDNVNPKDDGFIYKKYWAGRYKTKCDNKAMLQKELGLIENPDIPVFAVISRLVDHKGIPLIERVGENIPLKGAQLVVIGTGEKRFEDYFRWLADKYPGMVSSNITFSNELASKVYAGADFFLMPSKSEPCGLSQMIAMKYGTIPIVRETGGLFDTVPPYNEMTGEGRGFTFKVYNAHDMLDAIMRAIEFYGKKEPLKALSKKIMLEDFSWTGAAKEYLNLYNGG